MDIFAEASAQADWKARADWFQRCLQQHYYNEETGIMNQWFPKAHIRPDDNFYYWWQAHVMDVLVDAYERTGDPAAPLRIREFSRCLRAYNGGTFSHNYYDDMEWTALALLRAYQATGEEEYKNAVLELWSDIQTAWNSHFGEEWPGRRISWIIRTPRLMRPPPFWLPVCTDYSGIRRIWNGRSVFTNGTKPIWWIPAQALYGTESTGWETARLIMTGNSLTARSVSWSGA